MLVRPLALSLALLALTAGTAAGASVCSTSCWAAPAGSGALLVFNGHGWGHGVGMSQYGAYGYAQHGSTYEQILDHYYPGTTLGPAPASTIRVLLADGKKKVKIVADAPFTLRDGAGKTHRLPAGPTVLVAKTLKWPAPLTLKPARNAYLTLGNRYRGTFLVDVLDGKLRVIDIVGLEQYLWGVVPSEMPSTWASEALKAQAVAARSYALATRAVGAPFDVYSDTRSQMYLGVDHESPATTAAVNATKGKVVLWQGKVATTFFFSTSGGQTESSANWTGTALPYLISVPDPYDTLSPYHDWGPTPVTAKAILSALKLTGPITDVATAPNTSGRVGQVKLVTPLTALAVSAAKLRAAASLRSTWFTISLLSLTPPQPAAPVVYGGKVTLSSIVRGLQGVTLEQRIAGGTWEPLRTVATGSAKVTASPTATTDYRLATSTVAAGSIRIRVMPVVTVANATSLVVAGAVTPPLPAAAISVQQQSPDLTWTEVATGQVGMDGTFDVSGAFTPGATLRVVVTPAAPWAAGTSAALVVSG
jgi:stage II sporulation protein D